MSKAIKSILRNLHQLEMYKQILVGHIGFDVDAAFRMLDINNDGAITANELVDIVEKYSIETKATDEMGWLMKKLKKDEDMAISHSKFRELCMPILEKPAHIVRQANHHNSPRRQDNSPTRRGGRPHSQLHSGLPDNEDIRHLHMCSWLAALMDVLNQHLITQAEHEKLCLSSIVNCDLTFDEMDPKKRGWCSHKEFADWVEKNCFFRLCDKDMKIL